MYANQLLSSPAVLQPRPGQSSAAPQEPVQQKPLQQLVSTTDIHVLEKGVNAGTKFLRSLKEPLEAYSSPDGTDAANWIKAVDELLSRPQQTRTIVGVVGNTGAGKSSVINAVLDEERLLPTNGMRACTASATEVSYNDSDDPAQRYRAEIEFITADDWLKELEILYGDLLNSEGKVVKECTNGDTDAGRAYAKIKAVYPSITRDQIERSEPAVLVADYAVKRVLGTVLQFQTSTAESMYKRLQSYVDSKEKTVKAEKKMEHWPLIKVVRMYTKASALSTGAVIVDLPGVQDSNAARAAVAANYMKQCTGLWIVAPITRAVDDKTAKKLLGDSFRRQLMYDGTYSAVTFICSKTDDISVTEVADSLGLEDRFAEDWAKIDVLDATLEERATHVQELKDRKAALADLVDQVEADWDRWDDLNQKLSDGRTVYAPSPDAGKKRRRVEKSSKSRKKRLSIDTDSDTASDNDSDYDSLSGSDKENGGRDEDDDREPLTEEQIEEKLSQLKAQKKALRDERKHIDEQISNLRTEMKDLTLEKGKLDSNVRAVCIKGRNNYSREAIKNDFAQGIKELDQVNAMQMDEASFDPEQDLRDYDKVAESLPVFCVSSRAFQQMRGRMKKDNFNHNGYRCPEDTEVPQLQHHARQLTEAGRVMTARMFLNDLATLIGSMTMWAANDGTSPFTKNEKNVQQSSLQHRLGQLDKDFRNAIDACVRDIKAALNGQIYESFGKTLPLARDSANATAQSWGTQFWSTYKATVRRNGVWHRNYNAELWQPMEVQLTSGWERFFQRRLPSLLQAFVVNLTKMLETFHNDAVGYAKEHCLNLAGVLMLDQQLQGYRQRLKDVPAMVTAITQEVQKEANRSFTPVIQEDMQSAYTACYEERGPGSYMRMKNHMAAHVDTAKDTMFKHATDNVTQQLNAMCDRICQELCAFILQGVYQQISHDYQAVLVGSDKQTFSSLTRAERMLRGEMLLALQQVDTAFVECLPSAPAQSARTSVVDPQTEQEVEAPPGVEANAEPGADARIKPEDEPSSEPDIEAQIKGEAEAYSQSAIATDTERVIKAESD